jgi:PKD repeat protein
VSAYRDQFPEAALNRVLGIALSILGWAVVCSPQQTAATPEPTLDIDHVPPACMDTEEFPLIEARASTPEAAHRLSDLMVRFKSDEDTGWYEIALERPTGADFQVVLPKPLPEAVRVTYYFAAGTPERRSPTFRVPVLMGGCPGAVGAPSSSVTAGIRIRRTSNDQSEIPAGFSPDGIEPTSRWSGTTFGLLAAAGAGAGVAALAIGGNETVPEDGGGIVNPEAPRACFTPDPIPDIESGGRILFDASCSTPSTLTSYQWDFGDLSTARGSSVEHLFTPGGIYRVTLTVSNGQLADSTSRVVRVIATPSACFVTAPDPPRITTSESIAFNAECSVGDRDGGPTPITSYEWDFGDGRPGAEGRFVSRQFPRPDVYGVRLTVTNPDGRQATTTQFVVVEARATATRETRALQSDVTFTSHLEMARDSTVVRALMRVNAVAIETTSSPAPRPHQFRGRHGENVIEGSLLAQAPGPGRWRFDFARTEGFVPGSLQVDSGQVLSLDRQSVVFRVTGEPGAPLRFNFQLEE